MNEKPGQACKIGALWVKTGLGQTTGTTKKACLGLLILVSVGMSGCMFVGVLALLTLRQVPGGAAVGASAFMTVRSPGGDRQSNRSSGPMNDDPGQAFNGDVAVGEGAFYPAGCPWVLVPGTRRRAGSPDGTHRRDWSSGPLSGESRRAFKIGALRVGTGLGQAAGSTRKVCLSLLILMSVALLPLRRVPDDTAVGASAFAAARSPERKYQNKKSGGPMSEKPGQACKIGALWVKTGLGQTTGTTKKACLGLLILVSVGMSGCMLRGVLAFLILEQVPDDPAVGASAFTAARAPDEIHHSTRKSGPMNDDPGQAFNGDAAVGEGAFYPAGCPWILVPGTRCPVRSPDGKRHGKRSSGPMSGDVRRAFKIGALWVDSGLGQTAGTPRKTCLSLLILMSVALLPRRRVPDDAAVGAGAFKPAGPPERKHQNNGSTGPMSEKPGRAFRSGALWVKTGLGHATGTTKKACLSLLINVTTGAGTA